MFKIMHTSDLGLKNHPYGGINPKTGLNKRFEDVNRTLMYVTNKTIKNGCKYCIMAGDMNEERNPESILIEKLAAQIKKLIDKGIRVIVAAGNHDLDGSLGTSTSVSYLKQLDLPNLYIADVENEYFYFEDDDIEFHCYPYLVKEMVGYETQDELSAYVNKEIKEREFKAKHNVLVAHYSTEKTFEGLQVDEVKLSMKAMKRYDYVALGHIHRYEMFEDEGICGGYSGSIYKKDFGENYDKFVNLVKVDKKVTYEKMKLPVREFIEIEIDATDCGHEEFYDFVYENLTGQVHNKIVKIKVKVDKRLNPKPIYDFLRKEKAFHFVPVIWEVTRRKEPVKIANAGKLNDVEIVEEALQTLPYDKKLVEPINIFCKDIINEYQNTQS